jgi:hypothetical protein
MSSQHKRMQRLYDCCACKGCTTAVQCPAASQHKFTQTQFVSRCHCFCRQLSAYGQASPARTVPDAAATQNSALLLWGGGTKLSVGTPFKLTACLGAANPTTTQWLAPRKQWHWNLDLGWREWQRSHSQTCSRIDSFRNGLGNNKPFAA